MKKLLFTFTLSLSLFMAACSYSSGEAESENLIDTEVAESGYYINYNGGESENEEMLTSDIIMYDPAKEYEINRSSYVSYYNGEEFIETVQYKEDPPMTLDTVEDADRIRVGFNAYNEDSIALTEAE